MSNHIDKCVLNGESPEKDDPVLSGGIYKIVCKGNQKFYLGSSRNILYRLKKHLRDLKKNKHVNTILQNSYNKYGEESLEFFVVETCEVVGQELRDIEQTYLDKIENWSESFNICKDSRGGRIMNPESERIRRQKLSEAGKKKTGKDNNFFGCTHSEETKSIIGKKNSEYERTPEMRANMSKAQTGRKHTEETKKKIGKKGGANVMAKPVTICGVHYSCKKEALEAYGLKYWYQLENLLNAERLELSS